MNVYIYFFLLSFPWSSGEKRGEKRESARRGLEGVLGGTRAARKAEYIWQVERGA